MPRLKFDPQALYEAIDAQRRERGMTWKELANELCVSTSTIKGMTRRQWGIELDGVMGMTRWLGRTVESFAGGDGGLSKSGVVTKSGRYTRFDTTALYVAVDEQRQRRSLTWEQVALEVWPTGPWGPNQLKRLAAGGRTYTALLRFAVGSIERFCRLRTKLCFEFCCPVEACPLSQSSKSAPVG